MTPITTRAARASDAPQITRMIAELASFHNDCAEISEEDLIFLCFGPVPWMTLLVAESSGNMVGYAALQRRTQLQFARRLMDVQHLYVDANMRGLGIGRALTDAVCEAARLQRCTGVTLGVTAQNTGAQGFYQRLGFCENETPGAIQLIRALDLHAPVGAS